MKIQNPIIRGFYPDPSICRANGKYYIASSSFQYFPGVPLFESEDLVNWRQVGHCLTRLDQVELHRINSSGGVFAPTLRYHEGTFYMVTNNNTFGRNFYVSANDIGGQWSAPIFVDQEGIDPSLLFDGGKVYFTSNGTDENGKGCILQCEIDIRTGEKLTESIPIWSGSGGRYLESPHLYHIGDWYYLMAAEGGTEYGHMITYARSRQPFGPYEPYPGNPVLTNRNLGGNENFIQGIGHGDLIEDEQGNFFVVCLGFRQSGAWSPFHHLGREVFLAPVQWQPDGWFTAGDQGVVKEWMDLPVKEGRRADRLYDLSLEGGLKDMRWIYLRDRREECYREESGTLALKGTQIALNEADSPTFVGVRQSEFDTKLRVTVSGAAAEAGVTFYMDESQHYDLARVRDESGVGVVLRFRVGDAECIAGEVRLQEAAAAAEKDAVKAEAMENAAAELEVISTAEWYEFFCRIDGDRKCLGRARTKYLSSEVAGGFTGVVMGLYAVDGEGRWARFEGLDWKQGE